MRTTRSLVEIALTIALAFVLDELRIFALPQGGTVSLSMLPIIVLALLRGTGPAVIAGALFGMIDLATPPVYIVHPIQLLLDYPVPYACVGLAGLFRGVWDRAIVSRGRLIAIATALLPAVALGASARYAAHVVSGAVFFAEYAPEGQPVWVYSALYNLYVPISAVLCLVVAAAVLPALSRTLRIR